MLFESYYSTDKLYDRNPNYERIVIVITLAN